MISRGELKARICKLPIPDDDKIKIYQSVLLGDMRQRLDFNSYIDKLMQLKQDNKEIKK